MASPLNKKILKHIAELARIELVPREEDRFLKDLQKIVDYFGELQTLDTSGIAPMTGGTGEKNVFREDTPTRANESTGTEAFPETQNGYLRVPPVFEQFPQ